MDIPVPPTNDGLWADSDVPSKCRGHSATGRDEVHTGLSRRRQTAEHPAVDLSVPHRQWQHFRARDPI